MLNETHTKGEFLLTALTDVDGFALITIADERCCDPDIYAGVAANLKRTAERARSQLEMGTMDEISIYYKDGTRLVCRLFQAHGQDMILFVLVPKRHRYRMLTNRAISAIKREWAT
jgi:predicted regulator of Ras-like GTPase activity (Roadblock/LC7/MglB family)